MLIRVIKQGHAFKYVVVPQVSNAVLCLDRLFYLKRGDWASLLTRSYITKDLDGYRNANQLERVW